MTPQKLHNSLLEYQSIKTENPTRTVWKWFKCCLIKKKLEPLHIHPYVLYENIDQILRNKLHGPLHFKIGVTCVYNGHVSHTLL